MVNPSSIGLVLTVLTAAAATQGGAASSPPAIEGISSVGDPKLLLLHHPDLPRAHPPPLRAYVTNFPQTAVAENVTVCDISGDKLMCEPQGQLVSQEPTGIALSPDGGTAYIVQVAGSITVRNILPNGTFQSSNRNSTGSNLVGPLGITISPDGTKAYVVNFGAKPGSISNVTVCNIDVGSDLSCSEPSGTNFNGSVGIALNPIGSIAYVTNNADNSITACRTFGDRLTDCQVSAQKNLDQPAGIAISPDGLTAYVTNNGNNTLSICRVLDYTLQCGRGLDLHGLLKDPGLVTLSRDGSQLFIANSGANNVVVCSVSGQEVQEPCHATGSNFATPFDVAVY